MATGRRDPLPPGGSVDRGSNATLAAELGGTHRIQCGPPRSRRPTDTLPYAVVERSRTSRQSSWRLAVGPPVWLVVGSRAGHGGCGVRGAGFKLAMWSRPILNPRPELADAARFSRPGGGGKRDEAAEYFMGTVVGMPPNRGRRTPVAMVAGQVKIRPRSSTTPRHGRLPHTEDKARSVGVRRSLSTVARASRHALDRGSAAELIPNAQRATLAGQHTTSTRLRSRRCCATSSSARKDSDAIHTTILQGDKTATGIRIPDAIVDALGSGKRPPSPSPSTATRIADSIAVLAGYWSA